MITIYNSGNLVYATGDTFQKKEAFRRIGCRWIAGLKAWGKTTTSEVEAKQVELAMKKIVGKVHDGWLPVDGCAECARLKTCCPRCRHDD